MFIKCLMNTDLHGRLAPPHRKSRCHSVMKSLPSMKVMRKGFGMDAKCGMWSHDPDVIGVTLLPIL